MFQNRCRNRAHKNPLSHSTSGAGCCQTAAGNFLPRVTCRGDTSQGQRQSQVPWVESLLYQHLNLPKPSSLNLDPFAWRPLFSGSGKGCQDCSCRWRPQRPGWVCPEDLEVGPGFLSAAGFSITPLAPCSVFGVAKWNRDFRKKNWDSS